jgi:glycosyltransferase involved in cell wall biosynthesis
MMSLSVIIPAFNEEKYLYLTLNNLKEQNLEKFEIIVVCNGCEDKSFDVAKRYADKVFNLKERNVSKARNFGADKAKFSKLVFLDADVLLDKDVLEKVNEALVEGRFYGTVKGKGKGLRNKSYLTVKNLVNKFRPWSHGFVYCDKKGFFEVKGFNENMTRGELRDFFDKVKGKYKRLNVYVEPNDRRIRNWGLGKAIFYWLFKKNKEEYEAIR